MSKLPSLCLSKRQIEIMIKYYYMKSLVKVAKDENLTANQVKGLLSNGFRIMRLAYAPLFRKGLYFDASAVFGRMAETSGMTEQELCGVYQQTIAEGFASGDRELWEHAAAGQELTPLGLLSFLWAKFEADIVPPHTWDRFGKE
ncbi:MAG: hypothetical protein FWF08_06880 [Oscillospiraceae bacterium]|nr:hypothetical protein [Oscillospiraceae bacterium]